MSEKKESSIKISTCLILWAVLIIPISVIAIINTCNKEPLDIKQMSKSQFITEAAGSASPDSIIEASATSVWKEFMKEYNSFEDKYSDRIINLSGEVWKKYHVEGKFYVVELIGDVRDSVTPFTIYCYFEYVPESRIDDVITGNFITVEGRVKQSRTMIELENCEVLCFDLIEDAYLREMKEYNKQYE